MIKIKCFSCGKELIVPHQFANQNAYCNKNCLSNYLEINKKRN